MAATLFKLHGPYESFAFTGAATYAAGELEKIEDTVGVVLGPRGGAAVSGETCVLVYKAEKITVVKSVTSGQNAWSAGAKLYLDEAEKAICNSASGNVLCGIALQDQVAADATCLIALDGNLAVVA